MNLESEFQSAIASQILRGDGRYGYQIILQFSHIFLVRGLLTLDCPTQDDADAIVQTFGAELYRIIERKLPQVERIEIQAGGETVYPPHPPGCMFWA